MRPILGDQARDACERFFATIPIISPREPSRVVHPRLGSAAFLRRADAVIEVGSWGWAGTGDPAASLFRTWMWGGNVFLEDVAARLPWADEPLLRRVRFLGRCAALFDLQRARVHGDAVAARLAIRALGEAP